MDAKEFDPLAGLTPLELARIAKPPEAEELSSLSWDSIKRNHPDKVIKLGPRREGIRVGHALMIRTQHKGAK